MTKQTDELYGQVASILGDYEIVINRGTDHSVEEGDIFAIYFPGKEIKDPETGDSLGILEFLKGRGIVTFTQHNMAVVKSVEKRFPSGTAMSGIFDVLIRQDDDDLYLKKFTDIRVGDVVKRQD